MAAFPNDACIPPWAADEWDRLGGTILRQILSKPAAAASTATRSPASPAPMLSRSVYMVSNGKLLKLGYLSKIMLFPFSK
jgi:hypothetical protein